MINAPVTSPVLSSFGTPALQLSPMVMTEIINTRVPAPPRSKPAALAVVSKRLVSRAMLAASTAGTTQLTIFRDHSIYRARPVFPQTIWSVLITLRRSAAILAK